jgi:mRNA export factor
MAAFGMNTVAPQQDTPITGFSDSISSVVFKQTGQAGQPVQGPEFLAAGSWDNSVRVFQISAGGPAGPIQAVPGPVNSTHKAPVLCVAFGPRNSPIENQVFSGSCDNTFCQWDYVSQRTIPVASAHQSPISCISGAMLGGSSPAIATAGWDKFLKYWDVRQPPTAPAIQVMLPERAYCMDVKEHLLTVGLADGSVNIYNLNSPNQPMKTTRTKLTAQLRDIKIWPDLNGFCVGSIEGRVSVEFFQEPKPNSSFTFKCHREDVMPGQKHQGQRVFPVNALAFNHTGTFATGGADGVICFWDKLNRRKLKQLPKLPAPSCVSALCFNSSSTLLAYANSYDWHKGHQFHNSSAQNSLFIHRIIPGEISSR